MPTDSPNQRALTIALFVMCILFMIVLITSIVLGYETVEYDEVILILILIFLPNFKRSLF